jgi:hypothetical protein
MSVRAGVEEAFGQMVWTTEPTFVGVVPGWGVSGRSLTEHPRACRLEGELPLEEHQHLPHPCRGAVEEVGCLYRALQVEVNWERQYYLLLEPHP